MVTLVPRWMPLVAVVLATTACDRPPRDATDYSCPDGTEWDGDRCVYARAPCPGGAPRIDGVCATMVAADPLEGSYSVSGARPDGKPYGGTAHITAVANGGPYRIEWTLAGATLHGVASKRGDVLSVGWSDGKAYGVVDYVARGDGALDGVWYDADHAGPGRERLVGGQSNLAGVYTIETASAPGGGGYTGSCDIAVLGDLHYVAWHVGKDTFRGLGLRDGDVLSVGFSTEPSENFGVLQYKINGTQLVGRWAESSQKLPGLGSETLTRNN